MITASSIPAWPLLEEEEEEKDDSGAIIATALESLWTALAVVAMTSNLKEFTRGKAKRDEARGRKGRNEQPTRI